MSIKLIFVIALVIAIAAVACLRKLKTIAVSIALAAVLVLGFAGHVIFVPSSSVSIWVTEKIAPLIVFDSNDAFKPGEVIVSFQLSASGDKTARPSVAESDLNQLRDATRDFVIDRLLAIVEAHQDSLESEYMIQFKDAYLQLVPGDTQFFIIKGELAG